MNILDGRHYVTISSRRRFRRFVVMRQNVTRGPASTKMTYDVISRHWTWTGATKAVRRANGARGHSS